jgi:hypothetical protein
LEPWGWESHGADVLGDGGPVSSNCVFTVAAPPWHNLQKRAFGARLRLHRLAFLCVMMRVAGADAFNLLLARQCLYLFKIFEQAPSVDQLDQRVRDQCLAGSRATGPEPANKP